MLINDSDDGLLPALGLLAVVTAPIWLPPLLGIKTKNCRCGAELCASGICPVCRCEY